jgi:hypothetical protein
LTIFLTIWGLLLLLLNIMGTNAAVQSKLYDRTQLIVQFLILWLLPFVGALFVLYMLRSYRTGSLESTDTGFWASADSWLWAALGADSPGLISPETHHSDYVHHHHGGHDSDASVEQGDDGSAN